jgi:hypothetical protein
MLRLTPVLACAVNDTLDNDSTALMANNATPNAIAAIRTEERLWLMVSSLKDVMILSAWLPTAPPITRWMSATQ